MKKVIGYLKNLSETCFAKDAQGNLREIHPGDQIFSGEIIVDASGHFIPDAIRAVVENKVDETSNEANTETFSTDDEKKPSKESGEEGSKSTTSTDNFEDEYAEHNINAQLRENRFNSDDFWLQNTGLLRTQLDDEVNINAPLRNYFFPDTEFTPRPHFIAQAQSIVLKVVPTDIDGNIIDPATIPEGATAYYKVIALDQQGNQITDIDGTVNIAFADGSAGSSGTTQTGTLDYAAQNLTVQIGQVFHADALDDFMSDNGETFNVGLVNGTFSDSAHYGSVTYDPTPVTTTIIDDTGTPNDPADDTIEDDHETVMIKLVALDDNGDPILDGNGDYTFVNSATEGHDGNYMALAFQPNETTFSPATKLPIQAGTVEVTFADGSAGGANPQTAHDGTQDYNNATQIVTLGTVIHTATFDDFISDDNETFTISMTNGSYAPDANGGYENVNIDTSPVTTTVLDDATSHEIVPIKLIAADDAGNPILEADGVTYAVVNSVAEGGNGHYIALAFQPGSTAFTTATVLAPANQLGTVTVTTADLAPAEAVGIAGAQTAHDGSEDYSSLNAQTVTLNQAFTVTTLDDYMADNNEDYHISIDNGSYTRPTPTTGYENVALDTNPVTTTITDNSQPNTPNDSTDGPEVNAEEVIIKVFASDVNGVPLTDGAGNYLTVNDVPEGSATHYVALAFEPGTVTFNDTTKLPVQGGSVDFTFTDGTATVNTAANAPEGSNDYNPQANLSSITLGTAVNMDALDDYISDNNETLTITIDNYTSPATPVYEDVSVDNNPVTTTITDDTGTPNIPNDGPEADHESVIIKLVALNTDGTPVLDGNGDYTFANGVNEGSDAKYMAVAFEPGETTFSPGTQLANQVGTIDVTFANGTGTGANAQTTSDGSEDFNNTAQATITLGQAITTATYDDYLSDNGETFTVAITDNSYAPDGAGNGYENVAIDTSAVTTTITDDTGTPNIPNDGPEADHESVIIKLVALNTDGTPVLDGNGDYTFANGVNEGSDAKYMAVAFEPGETTFSPGTQLANQVGTIDVTFANGTGTGANAQTTSDGSEDFNNTAQATITLGQAITTATYDDYLSDNGETFTVAITDNSYAPDGAGNGYENVAIDTSAVTTTISDNSAHTPNDPYDENDPANPPVETDLDAITIKLFAIDPATGNRVPANEVAEGSSAQYVAVAFDKDGNEVLAGETVDVTFGAVGDTATAGGTDYTSTPQTVTLGTNFSTPTTDDYLSDNNEVYSVQITDQTLSNASNYETVIIDTTAVTTTIKDGANETDGGTSPVDTVYVQLSGDASQVEADGALLTHNLKLVDKDGNPVNLANGETVTVNLTYSNDTTADADFQGGKVTTVTITGDGGSDYSFSNTIFDDLINEPTESYDVVIGSASSTYFENMLPDPGLNGNPAVNGATGTIIEEVDLLPDTATVVEGSVTITDATAGMHNLLDNDELGVNGQITTFEYIPEGGGPAVTANAGETVNTQYGTVTINANGTWTFISDVTENNPAGINDIINYTVTDDDNKTDTTTFTVTVTDTNPSASTVNSVLDEDDLATGSQTAPKDALSVEQTVTINKAADDIADVYFDNDTITTLNGENLTSNGVALSYALSNSNHTLTASAGGVEIFTVNFNNPTDATGTTQTYTYELKGNIDHPNADGQNQVDIPMKFKVSDTDSTVAGGDFTVSIIDDVPTANPEAALSVVEGNVDLVGMINLMDNDVTGADDSLSLVGFRYTDESGTLQDGVFGSAMNTIYGTLTVQTNGSWTYTSDETEHNESGTDHLQTNDFVTDSFSYTIQDRDGDQSTSLQSIKVTDGANPTINPDNGVVDEASLGLVSILNPTEITETLNVTKGSDNIDDTVFTTTEADLNALNLKSGGEDLSYNVTDHLIIATNPGGEEVFRVTLNNPTNPAGGTQSYTFKLSKPLDHIDNGNNDTNDVGHNPLYIPLSVATFDTDNANGIDGDDDMGNSFTIQVLDSVPVTADQTITTNEDTDATIRISIDDLSDVKITPTNGIEVSLATNASTSIYDTDGNDVIGSILNNGDGTLTFTPNPDYSNYSNTLPTFDYSITDEDGDTASATVTVKVNPVADTPTDENDKVLQTVEDTDIDTVTTDTSHGNYAEGNNVTPLSLILPTRADQTDQNNITGNAPGDSPERLGLIEFNFTTDNSGTLVYDSNGDGTLDTTLQAFGDGTTFSIDITDVANYHPTGTSGTYHLTQAQYNSLAIIHAEDNDADVNLSISVASHEVQDDGSLLSPDVVSSVATQNIELDILAVTDNITLKFDEDGGVGTLGTTTEADDTLNLNPIPEDSAIIDLKEFLTNTNGLENDPFGDLDGSEHRSYTISGIPEGTIISLGGTQVAADATGTVTIDFPDNTVDDPEFIMTPSPQYSGTINATITLNVTDTDTDSVVAPETKSAIVYLNVDITPVADTVTLQVAQAIGDEDAGRLHGNDANDGTAPVVDDASNGIDLDIKVTSDDTDGSEIYTVILGDNAGGNDGLPDGSSIYYDGTTIDKNTPSGGGFTITVNGDGSWNLKIDDFDNDAPLKFIPVHNEDADYLFNVDAYSTDGADTSALQSLQIDVTVNGIADIPVNTGLNTAVHHGETYTATYDEAALDTVGQHRIALTDVYSTPNPTTDIHSYDNDSSETLTIVVSGLNAELNLEYATFLGGSGTDRRWSITPDELANVQIVTPENFSGEIPFTLQYITTEREGDSATSTTESTNDIISGNNIDNVKLWVNPAAESTINDAVTQTEDTPQLLDFSIDQHGDTNEALTAVYIKKDSIPNDVTLSLNGGNDLATEAGSNADVTDDGTYYIITGNAINNVLTTVDTAHKDDNYALTIKYEITDNTNTNAPTDQASVTTSAELPYNVTVIAVADKPTVTQTADANQRLDSDGDGNYESELTTFNADVNGQNVDVYDVATDTIANIQVDLSSADLDGSEHHDFYKLTNVPTGVEVIGASDGGNGVWFLPATGNTAAGISTQDIQFRFTSGVDLSLNYAVQIEGHNLDNDNSTNIADPITIYFGNKDTPDGSAAFNPPTNISLIPQDVTVDEDTNAPMSVTDAFTVNVSGGTSNDFTVRLSGLPAGTIVSHAHQEIVGGQTVWIINKADYASAVITYPQDYNENHQGGAVPLHAELIVPMGDGTNTIRNEDSDVTITPVTDPVEITQTLTHYDDVTAGAPDTVTPTAQEDGRTDININLATVDNPDFDYTDAGGNPVTTIDITTDNGVAGQLINTATGTPYTLTGGDHWTVNIADLSTLRFVPDQDASGTVNLTYTINTKETGASNVESSSETITLDVAPINDGYNPILNQPALGNEDEFILVDIDSQAIDTDGSEKIFAAILDNIPNGVLVYYKDAANHDTLASNTGSSDGGLTNSWSIPLTNGALPQVWIKAPENWSGTLPNVGLTLFSSEADVGGSPINDLTQNSLHFDVTIDPVVDTLTIDPTKTFGREGNNIKLKLNANIEDLDGSETVSLKLDNIGPDAYFTINGQDLPTSTVVSYDAGSDRYTITGIDVNDINSLRVTQSAMPLTNIHVIANMVESNGDVGADVAGDFTLRIREAHANNGNNRLFYDGDDIDGLGGDDTVRIKVDHDIDFAGTATPLANIETIDLRKNGDHTLQNISSLDVERMTDGNNTLLIKTDAGDVVNLTNDWAQAGNTYTNNGVTLTINGAGTVTTTSAVIDGLVGGLQYTTSSGLSGITDDDGSFTHAFGDTVTFAIGNVLIGDIQTADITDGKVFLQDIAGTQRTDLSDTYVENMAVLLQSLDVDGDAYNGITITEAMRDAFSDSSFDLATISEADLKAIIENTGNEAVSENDAMEHVQDMLVNYTNLENVDFEISSHNDTILYHGNPLDGLAGEDTVIIQDLQAVDFSQLSNMEKIDLNSGNHDLGIVTLSDVVNMTDADNDLSIEGDSNDAVTLRTNDGWSHDAGQDIAGHNTYVNSNDPTVLVQVDDQIVVTVA